MCWCMHSLALALQEGPYVKNATSDTINTETKSKQEYRSRLIKISCDCYEIRLSFEDEF